MLRINKMRHLNAINVRKKELDSMTTMFKNINKDEAHELQN